MLLNGIYQVSFKVGLILEHVNQTELWTDRGRVNKPTVEKGLSGTLPWGGVGVEEKARLWFGP